MSRSARRKPAPAPAPPPAPTTPRPGTRATYKQHTERASCDVDRGAVCGENGRSPAAPPRSRISTARPTPHTRTALTRAARRGWGPQTPSQASGSLFPPPPNPERKAKEPERGDKRKDSTLRVRGWELPLPPGEVKPLAAPPTSNPPTQTFKPLSPPRYLPLLQAYQTGPESWRGAGRERSGESSVQASLRGGEKTIPTEVACGDSPRKPRA